MANKAGQQNVYCVAILAMKASRVSWGLGEPRLDATLDANAVIASSHDDARLKALELAREKYPESEGYTDYSIQTCEIYKAINEYLRAFAEEWSWERLKELLGGGETDESDLPN
jgi:hypothetical protein